LRNKEQYNLHYSPYTCIIRVIKLMVMRLTGHATCKGEMSKTYQIFVKKFEKKRSLGRHRHGWEDNIKVDL